MNEANPVTDIWTFIKSQDKALVEPSVEILKRMYFEKNYGINVLHGIQNYFLGPFNGQKEIALTDTFSIAYRKRVRFLYVLDKLIRENPNFQPVLRQIKKETGPKKLGVVTNDMTRRMAFLWAAIEREK
jgi:hypothetical protein